MLEIVEATMEHAERMAPRMRREDSTEVMALGMSPLDALRTSISASFIAHVAIIDGKEAAMWGACNASSLIGDKAFIWLLGTDLVPTNRKWLLKLSRDFCENINDMYPTLECMVDARYEKAVAWIRWLKFRVVGYYPAPSGVRFYVMARE